MNQPSEHEPLMDDRQPDLRSCKENPRSIALQSVPNPAGSALAKSSRVRPSFLFLGIVSLVTLTFDLGTKWWALHTLETPLGHGVGIPKPIFVAEWLTFVLARNRGGAWGLFQTAEETFRRPFFCAISLLAGAFIVYLYSKVHPKQHALKWGLPLVLGGAIGNLVDRIRYGWVIDFIDYSASWLMWINQQIAKLSSSHIVTDHWPTFNIADVAICIGVGLMAIDMFLPRRISAGQASQGSAPDSPSKTAEPSGSSMLAPTAVRSTASSSLPSSPSVPPRPAPSTD